MPLVLIDRYLPDAGMLSYVTTDNYRGAVMAAEYLLENGHRRIACIQGTPHSMPCGTACGDSATRCGRTASGTGSW